MRESKFTYKITALIRALCLIAIGLTFTPFIDNWYTQKVDQRLYAEKENAENHLRSAKSSIQEINERRAQGILNPEDNSLLSDLYSSAATQANKAANAAEKIAERAGEHYSSTPWWSRIPISVAPVALYDRMGDFFSPTIEWSSILLSFAVVVFLLFGLLGYWLSRLWGGVFMALFCCLFIFNRDLYFLYGPALSENAAGAASLALSMLPSGLIYWNSKKIPRDGPLPN